MSLSPSLSIITVSWNTRALLDQCLASVFADPPRCAFDVWVVDNASQDQSAAFVRHKYPRVRLIENDSNAGFARANNQAMAQSDGDYVLLLNSDTVALPGMLDEMVQWMEAHPEAGIVGGTLMNPDGSFQASHGDYPTLVSELLNVAGVARWFYGPYFPSHPPVASQGAIPADWVGGACLMARRQAIAGVGPLDEGYFMYAEEMDWCYRMTKAGRGVFSLPAARCVHWGGQSSAQVSRITPARLVAATHRFMKKHYGAVPAAAFRAGAGALGIAKAAVFAVLALAHRARRGYWHDKAVANLTLALEGFR